MLPTKMYWDWSTAGEKKDGKPYADHGPFGKHTYNTKKGSFIWEKNVEPSYFWFNGSLDYVLLSDPIDPSQPVELNHVVGNSKDNRSRIYPFKVHRGKQPYDAGNNTMAALHLFSGKEPTAYWGAYDWDKAIAAGAEFTGLTYSGKYGFVETRYHFPITHMVAPKDQALSCEECHSLNGRLADVAGIYMPGMHRIPGLDIVGWIVVLGSLVAVIIHGFLRYVHKRNGNRGR